MPKENIHPISQIVAFLDISSNKIFLLSSTIKPSETIEIEGIVYPLCRVEISSASHHFFTGNKSNINNIGSIEKFYNKYKAYNGFNKIKNIDNKNDK